MCFRKERCTAQTEPSRGRIATVKVSMQLDVKSEPSLKSV